MGRKRSRFRRGASYRPRRGRGRHPTLEGYLGWRKRRRGLAGVITVLALVLLILGDRRGLFSQPSGDWSRYHKKEFQVVRVIDGDTLTINSPDGEERVTRVRLWGIDTPELKRPGRRNTDEPYALEATEYARQACEGRRVRLILEQHSTRGKFGRLLAYIELPDGSLLNEQLLVEGLATAEDRFPHRWLDRYSLIESQARHDGVGIWSEKGR